MTAVDSTPSANVLLFMSCVSRTSALVTPAIHGCEANSTHLSFPFANLSEFSTCRTACLKMISCYPLCCEGSQMHTYEHATRIVKQCYVSPSGASQFAQV